MIPDFTDTVVAQFKRRWDDEMEILEDNFRVRDNTGLRQSRMAMEGQFLLELVEGSPWPFVIERSEWSGPALLDLTTTVVFFGVKHDRPWREIIDEIQDALYENSAMSGNFEMVDVPFFPNPETAEWGNEASALWDAENHRKVHVGRYYRVLSATIPGMKDLMSIRCPKSVLVQVTDMALDNEGNSAAESYVTYRWMCRIIGTANKFIYLEGPTIRVASGAPVRETPKWTVIGVWQDQNIFEHVTCEKDEAWNVAVRQASKGATEDAYPSGYTGNCVAILSGHVQKGE